MKTAPAARLVLACSLVAFVGLDGVAAAQTPSSYFRFEEGSPNSQATAAASVINSGVTAHHGTPQGGPTYRSTIPTAQVRCLSNTLSMEFDGQDDVVVVSAPFILNAQYGDATLEFWIKTSVTDHRAIFWGREDQTDVNRFHVYTGMNGTFGIDYRDTLGHLHTLLADDGTLNISPDTWTHIAATRVVEASGVHTYRFYKNGSLVTTTVDVAPDLPTSVAWSIAGRPPPHVRFAGFLDEIRMTAAALQPGQFSVDDVPCSYCTAKVNSQGCLPAIGWSGSPTIGGSDDFFVSATLVRNNAPGILFWGSAPASVPFAGGTRCVSSPIIRTAIQGSGGTPAPVRDCTGTYSFHFSHAYMTSYFLGVGSTVYAQFWQRDPPHLDGTGQGLTDGLVFTIRP